MYVGTVVAGVVVFWAMEAEAVQIGHKTFDVAAI
jgi:hypothetical protein